MKLFFLIKGYCLYNIYQACNAKFLLSEVCKWFGRLTGLAASVFGLQKFFNTMKTLLKG